MNFFRFIKQLFLFLLVFLLGTRIYAKAKLFLPLNNVCFSAELNQNFKSLEKELQLNIGFLKEKCTFVIFDGVSAQNQHEFFEYFVGNLANAGGKVDNYPNLIKSFKYKRVKRILSDNQIKTIKESLENAHPDVLKYIDDLDEMDFVQMIKAYKDNPNKFNLSIKKSVDFIGTKSRDGFLTFWKLTPKMKDGLSTIRKLKNEGKLLPAGSATDIQLASIQNYTAWGNFVNVLMRYGVHFGKYAEKAKRHIEQGLELLRKVPERNMVNRRVFSGKAYSLDDFNKLFVGKKGKEVVINKGFVSSTLDEKVAAHFANKTSKYLAEPNKAIRVIRRIKTKTGVYLDDLADYGQNLGPLKHSNPNVPPIERIQKEVLMKEGVFKQLNEPKLFKEVDGIKWYYIDFVELGKPLK